MAWGPTPACPKSEASLWRLPNTLPSKPDACCYGIWGTLVISVSWFTCLSLFHLSRARLVWAKLLAMVDSANWEHAQGVYFMCHIGSHMCHYFHPATTNGCRPHSDLPPAAVWWKRTNVGSRCFNVASHDCMNVVWRTLNDARKSPHLYRLWEGKTNWQHIMIFRNTWILKLCIVFGTSNYFGKLRDTVLAVLLGGKQKVGYNHSPISVHPSF